MSEDLGKVANEAEYESAIPFEILKSRLAAGDISADEFEKTLRVLVESEDQVSNTKQDTPELNSNLPSDGEELYLKFEPLRISFMESAKFWFLSIFMPAVGMIFTTILLHTFVLPANSILGAIFILFAFFYIIFRTILFAFDVYRQSRRSAVVLTTDSISIGHDKVLLRDVREVKLGLLSTLRIKTAERSLRLPLHAYSRPESYLQVMRAITNLVDASKAHAFAGDAASLNKPAAAIGVGSGSSKGRSAGLVLGLVCFGGGMIGAFLLWKHRPISGFADGLNRIAVDPELVVLKQEPFYIGLVLVAALVLYGLRRILAR
jgi:hypothetical protein